MREQISLMLQKNAISEISPDTPGFYSNAFMVRKASGGWRPDIDLKQLNHHIDAPHFRMHTISSVLSTVKKRRLCVQNRSTGCILSCTNTSTQQEVHPVSKAREIWHTHAGYPPRKPCHTEKCPNLWDHSIGPQVSSHWVIYT